MENLGLMQHLMMQRDELASHIRQLKEKHGELIDNSELREDILNGSYIKPNATEIEFIEGRIKFGKLDENGNFYLPLNSKGKTQSGTKDSMVVVFDGRS